MIGGVGVSLEEFEEFESDDVEDAGVLVEFGSFVKDVNVPFFVFVFDMNIFVSCDSC